MLSFLKSFDYDISLYEDFYGTLKRPKEEDFEVVKKSMNKEGNKFLASYPLWIYNEEGREMNEWFKQKVFQLILQENGYDYTFFIRLYEITEELKSDEEFLDFIKRAIKFKDEMKCQHIEVDLESKLSVRKPK